MLQLPLNVLLDDTARFDNFFTGANQQLNFRLQSLIDNPGEFIFVWGSSESGKTHLAQAVCRQFGENNKSAVYLPLDNIALTPEVLLGLSCMDLVCLDNVNAVSQSAEWQQALFDLYNNLKLDNKNLLLFSSAAPNQLALTLADLLSRFTAMEIYKLDSLDDQQKLVFFQQRAANRGIDVSAEVVHFLLARQSRSISDLIKMLDQIDLSSIALKRKVTIPLVKEIFNL